MRANDMNEKDLIKEAFEAQKKSISPYSKFRVGAALETEDGKIYYGANIENAAYSVTVCAERTALFTALLQGERKFKRIAVVSDSQTITAPCGACRQALNEFCDADFEVIMANKNGEYEIKTLGELLPYGFKGENLE